MTQTQDAGLLYLSDSGLELAHAADDVRGLAVLTPYGHRLGEVEDLVVDAQERRVRLLSVLSGGILGLGATERLVPVEAIIRVDDRVHLDHPHVGAADRGRDRVDPAAGPAFADVYERYGVVPFWTVGYVAPYFLRR
jgi:sporulation protein YlmC with PRC-barrel domain